MKGHGWAYKLWYGTYTYATVYDFERLLSGRFDIQHTKNLKR